MKCNKADQECEIWKKYQEALMTIDTQNIYIAMLEAQNRWMISERQIQTELNKRIDLYN